MEVYTTLDNIRIYKGIPWDNSYQDVRLFNDQADQARFFADKAAFKFDSMKPIELGNVLRIPIVADELYACNYITFRNENFGNKIFYAFIDRIQYVNKNLSYLYFSLDIMQTWQFEFNLKECYVEREHVDDDTVGKHTYPEGLEIGEPIATSQKSALMGELYIYMLATEVPEAAAPYFEISPGIIGGYPNACHICKFGPVSRPNISAIDAIVKAFDAEGKGDAITALFTAPGNFVSTTESVRTSSLTLSPLTLNGPVRNNKLKTWPFTYNVVSTGAGQAVQLAYENFRNNPSITIKSGFQPNLQVIGTPQGYKKEGPNYEYSITLTGFPLLPWRKQYYENWLALNKASLKAGVVTTVGSAVFGSLGDAVGASGDRENAAGYGASAINRIAGAAATLYNLNAKLTDMKAVPDSLVGQQTGADIMAVTGSLGFYSTCYSIKPEYLKVIDDYFTRQGYRVNAQKVPNIRSRKAFNYLKCASVSAFGDIPVDDMVRMKAVLLNGVTFWHNNDIGNYSQDNAII